MYKSIAPSASPRPKKKIEKQIEIEFRFASPTLLMLNKRKDTTALFSFSCANEIKSNQTEPNQIVPT